VENRRDVDVRSVKDLVIGRAMRLMSDPRVSRVMGDPRVMSAAMRAMSSAAP
jgi:hypothetical protein